MTPQEKAKDARLRKTYGITLEQYNQLLVAQDNKCAICRRPVSDFKVMNVDHFHFKISIIRCTPDEPLFGFAENALCSLQYNHGWVAVAHFDHIVLPWRWSKTKDVVKAMAKRDALPHSIRGILCPGRHGTGCNTKLGRADSIPFLENALSYLKNPPARNVISPPKTS